MGTFREITLDKKISRYCPFNDDHLVLCIALLETDNYSIECIVYQG
jgi:hypothetical protein